MSFRSIRTEALADLRLAAVIGSRRARGAAPLGAPEATTAKNVLLAPIGATTPAVATSSQLSA